MSIPSKPFYLAKAFDYVFTRYLSLLELNRMSNMFNKFLCISDVFFINYVMRLVLSDEGPILKFFAKGLVKKTTVGNR